MAPAGPCLSCTDSASSQDRPRPSNWPGLPTSMSPAAHPRQVRPQDRRGRVPPGLAPADDGRGQPWPARLPWASTEPGAHVARAAKFYVWTQAEAGHGCPISMTYSVIPALRHAPDLAVPLRGAADLRELRPRPARSGDQARPARRHGDDREAGRLRRSREHHARGAGRRRQLPPHRAQVVLLGADVRPVPGPGPGRRWS